MGISDSAGKMSFLLRLGTADDGRRDSPRTVPALHRSRKVARCRCRFPRKSGSGAHCENCRPYQIGSSGYLQEWIEDWNAGAQGHNVSPNFTFSPGSSITLRRDPLFAAAIQRWMEAHPARGGFPAAWDISVWARLERGDKVGEGIRAFVSKSVAANLHNAGANQSDATFGFTAGVAESLLQSHVRGSTRNRGNQPALGLAGELERRFGQRPASARRVRSEHPMERRETPVRRDRPSHG